MGPEPPTTIDKPKAIVAEGVDAHRFLIWACQGYGTQDVRVYDFGGIPNLRSYLKVFRETPGFDGVRTLVVARDAETSGSAAFQSAASALRATGFAVPRQAFCFAKGAPRTAVMIFPGYERKRGQRARLGRGMLEDLCLATVPNDPLMRCVEEYVKCARQTGEQLRHESKTRLHTFLAGKADYAGLKLGEATSAGAWDLKHAALRPFKRIILGM